MAARRGHLGLSQAQIGKAGAARDPQLRGHEVDAGDFLGDRVLHLHAGVHFAEGDGGRVVGVDEELPRAEASVADRARHGHGGIADGLPGGVRQRGRRGDLHDLLVLPLQRAFPLAQVRHRLAVAHHLHLDVAGTLDQPLHVEVAVPERSSSLAGAPLIGGLEFVGRTHHAHAAPTAAGQRLDHHRPVLIEEGPSGLH